MRSTSFPPILFSALALAACGGSPRQTSATAPTVTYSHDIGNSAEADARAREHCLREYGASVEVVQRGRERTTYECVSR